MNESKETHKKKINNITYNLYLAHNIYSGKGT